MHANTMLARNASTRFTRAAFVNRTSAARGLIERQSGAARSILLRLTRAQLPDLE
jgi:hypothetical protein